MPTWYVPLAGGGRAVAHFTLRSEGDFGIDAPAGELEARRRAVVDRPWVWLRQVHGAEVVALPSDGGGGDGPRRRSGIDPGADDVVPGRGREADALVTDRDDLAISVQVADCGPVALVSPQGVIGAVHAGWRGVEAGVIAAAATAMRALGADTIEAWVGPCIHAECYEFGPADLDRLATTLGADVTARTPSGAPAFDLPEALDHALREAGVIIQISEGPSRPPPHGGCTACDRSRYWSHRARRDEGRHALALWIEPPAANR